MREEKQRIGGGGGMNREYKRVKVTIYILTLVTVEGSLLSDSFTLLREVVFALNCRVLLGFKEYQ